MTEKITVNYQRGGSGSRDVQTSRRFRFVSAALAVVIWGSWAYFVNLKSAPSSAALSGLVQGFGSGLVTLIIVHIVTRCYQQLSRHPLQLLLPPVIATVATGSAIAMAHWVAGTSRLLATIAPGLIVAFCFNIFTAYRLRQQERSTDV